MLEAGELDERWVGSEHLCGDDRLGVALGRVLRFLNSSPAPQGGGRLAQGARQQAAGPPAHEDGRGAPRPPPRPSLEPLPSPQSHNGPPSNPSPAPQIIEPALRLFARDSDTRALELVPKAAQSAHLATGLLTLPHESITASSGLKYEQARPLSALRRSTPVYPSLNPPCPPVSVPQTPQEYLHSVISRICSAPWNHVRSLFLLLLSTPPSKALAAVARITSVLITRPPPTPRNHQADVAKIASLLREIPKTAEQLLLSVSTAVRALRRTQPAELPAAAYQLLLLAGSAGPGTAPARAEALRGLEAH